VGAGSAGRAGFHGADHSARENASSGLPASAAAATESTSGDAEMRTFRRSLGGEGRRDRDFGT